MASMSISGVVSGMDWESMIDEIITTAARPAQVQVNKKTNLQNKKSLFEEMKVMVQSIQSSMTSLKLPSTYKAKAVDIERVDGSGSYKGVLTATVNADAEVNVYDIVVKQLATAQTNRSKQTTSSTIGSLLSGTGITNSTMYINAGGQKIGIEVKSTDSLESLKSKINNTVKSLASPLAITASVVDNRLVIKSDNTGLGITTTEETFNYNLNGINYLQKISPDSNGTLKLTSNGKTYTEGTDYVVVNGNQIRWKQYDVGHQVSLGDTVNAKYTMAAGDVYSVKGTYGSSEAAISGFNLIDKGTLASRVKIVDDEGNSYSYGTDFKIEGKKVVWLENPAYGEPSSYTVSLSKTTTTTSQITGTKSGTATDDTISASDFEQLETAYNEKYGTSAIPTVTLTGSDGVLRTYLDPKDSSLFDMTADGKTYKYGRDYVIRVNDSGDGYEFSWLVTDDKNGDGSIDIKDANAEVSTYTAHKGISTSGWVAAPNADASYSFSFSNESTNSYSASMKSSDTDKNLSSVLGVTLDASDYSNIVIKNGSKTYTLGTDYEIDSSGNISWLDTTPKKPAGDISSITNDGSSITIQDTNGVTYIQNQDFTVDSENNIHWLVDDLPIHPTGNYTLTYEAFSALEAEGIYTSGSATTNLSDFSGVELSYSDILSDLKLTESSSNIDEEFAKVFTITSGATNLTYGTDYKIIADSNGDPVISWLSANTPAPGTTITLKYTGRGEGGGEVLTIDDAVTRSATDSVTAKYSDLKSGTTTITQGTKTFYEGEDYTLTADSDGYAQVNWITDADGGSEWYYPNPGSNYTITNTDANGNTKTYNAYRSSSSVLNMADLGMTNAKGSLSVQYGDDSLSYKLDVVDDEGHTGNDVLKATHSFTVNKGTKWTESGGDDIFTFNWLAPSITSRTDLPAYGDEITAEYEHEANTFTLSDNGDGLINALGLNDEENVTDAHNAILTIDGDEYQRDRNTISEAEGNELIKGMTINLKGLGQVSLDVYHDAEKAVEAINTFKDSYNDLMSWMNTRMTEKEVDKDTKSTIDSDDFRMRWGLLHGNSLLRNTKSQMRSLTSKSFTYSFTQRASASEIYGTMENNGLRSASTLRIRIGSTYSDVTIQPYQTLQDIVDMLNDKDNPEMRNMFYGDDGKLLDQPRVKASIDSDRLTITSTGNEAITISGTNAMNALKLNYTYKGLFQIGLATTSTDYGKSGELEFDESTFMEALEDNADEVQELMLMFANDMDSWLKSMLTTSASGETSGTLTRQIEDIDTQIKSIDEYLEKYQDRLDRQEEALRAKYASAEQSISKLSQQANSIAAILNQLNGYTASNSSSDS